MGQWSIIKRCATAAQVEKTLHRQISHHKPQVIPNQERLYQQWANWTSILLLMDSTIHFYDEDFKLFLPSKVTKSHFKITHYSEVSSGTAFISILLFTSSYFSWKRYSYQLSWWLQTFTLWSGHWANINWFWSTSAANHRGECLVWHSQDSKQERSEEWHNSPIYADRHTTSTTRTVK